MAEGGESIPLVISALKHPEPDSRECAAAAVGNLAAGNRRFVNEGGNQVLIMDQLLSAIPALLRMCLKIQPGPAEDCAATAAGALWRMMAADDMNNKDQRVKRAIDTVEGLSALNVVMRTGSSRGKENASKALEKLNTVTSAPEQVEQPEDAAPPITPAKNLKHDYDESAKDLKHESPKQELGEGVPTKELNNEEKTKEFENEERASVDFKERAQKDAFSVQILAA